MSNQPYSIDTMLIVSLFYYVWFCFSYPITEELYYMNVGTNVQGLSGLHVWSRYFLLSVSFFLSLFLSHLPSLLINTSACQPPICPNSWHGLACFSPSVSLSIYFIAHTYLYLICLHTFLYTFSICHAFYLGIKSSHFFISCFSFILWCNTWIHLCNKKWSLGKP